MVATGGAILGPPQRSGPTTNHWHPAVWRQHNAGGHLQGDEWNKSKGCTSPSQLTAGGPQNDVFF